MLLKARFWEKFAGFSFNDRQRLVVSRMLDGFEGKINTSKYAIIAKCSQDTALRDIELLVKLMSLCVTPREAAVRAIPSPNSKPARNIGYRK